MANKRVHLIGQSGANFSHDYQPPSGSNATTVFRNNLDTMFAGEHVFLVNGDAISSDPGTYAGGTSLYADWFVPDGNHANSASWALTATGQFAIDYVTTTLNGTQRGETDLIVFFWWENDSQGNGSPSAILHDATVAEIITRLRAAYGKTAAQLPVLLVGPGLYSNNTLAGQKIVEDGFNLVAARVGFNATRFPGLMRDTDWDKDAPGSYGSHGSADDNRQLWRRIARFVYRRYGPSWASTPRNYSGRGPRIVWVEYVNSTTLDAWVEHDGGNNLVLGANSNTANGLGLWRITSNGVLVAPTAVAIPTTGNGAGRRVRLTVPAMAGFQTVALGYGAQMTGRGNLQSGVLDNSDTYQSSLNLLLPTGISGADRIGLPIQALFNPIRARLGAPPTK